MLDEASCSLILYQIGPVNVNNNFLFILSMNKFFYFHLRCKRKVKCNGKEQANTIGISVNNSTDIELSKWIIGTIESPSTTTAHINNIFRINKIHNKIGMPNSKLNSLSSKIIRIKKTIHNQIGIAILNQI